MASSKTLLADVIYNDEVIGVIKSGQTATLRCAQKVMFTDLTIKGAEITGDLTSLIEKEITANGEYLASAYGADGFSKVIVDIETGGNLPEYDGTVIIEKANSVLGLRRFKESLTAIDGLNAVLNMPSIFLISLYKETYFEIEPVYIEAFGYTLYGLTPIINFTDNETTTDYPKMIWQVKAGGSDELQLITLDLSNGTDGFVGMEFNVKCISGTIAYEWLLANTEGVSV